MVVGATRTLIEFMLFKTIRKQLVFFWRLLQRKEGRALLWHHLKRSGFERPAKLRIVFCCNGVVPHGGLVDRLKGITSMYEIALQIEAEFYIQFTNPFELSTYFEPNAVAWKRSEIRFNPLYDRILHRIVHKDQQGVNPLDWFDDASPRTYFVYTNYNYLPNLFPDISWAQISDIRRAHFNTLFRRSNLLMKELSALPQEKRVVCHTRFVGMLGDFNDIFNRRLTESEITTLFATLDERLAQIASQHPDCPLYVLSDSPRFLAHIESLGTYRILPGTPKHIDVKNSETSTADHLKTITDFIFIAESEVIYGLQIPPLYPSTFCAGAAVLGKKQFKAIKE